MAGRYGLAALVSRGRRARAGWLIGLLLLSACYRPAGPGALPAGLRIVIDSMEARQPGIQTALHAALANEINRSCGWPIAPRSGHELHISIRADTIRDIERRLGIPSRWEITVQITARFADHQASFSATSTYSSLDNEPQGIATACQSTAELVANWLITLDQNHQLDQLRTAR